jgi:rhomboid protease GluP
MATSEATDTRSPSPAAGTSARATHTWVVYAIIALNLVMFGYELMMGCDAVDPTADQLRAVGASHPADTLGQQEYFRIPLSMFLHFGVMHLGLNLVCLWQGRLVEVVYGAASFIVIYLLAGLAGGLATLAVGGDKVSAGASGAVFGVYGAFAAFLLVRKSSIPPDAWKQTSTGIGFFIVVNLIFGFVVPAISMSAHVGGLVFGFVLGAALLAGTQPRTHPPGKRVGGVFAAGVLVIVLGLRLLPRPDAAADGTGGPVPAELLTFERVEAPALAKWSDLESRHSAKSIDDGKAADELERTIMGPWKLACEVLAKSEAGQQDKLLVLKATHCVAQLAAWESIRDAWRQPQGPQRDDLYMRYRLALRDVNEIGALFKVEYQRRFPQR